MKIIRFESKEGNIHHGEYDDKKPGSARIIKGNIFGDYSVSGKRAEIKQLLAPVEAITIFALGLNYGKHAEETGIDRPVIPIVFIKSVNTLTGPDSPIILPKAGPDEVDYEAELAVVIGSTAKNIAREDAFRHIFGYTCANDVSARDWQMRKQKGQWTRGKSFDTFCPLGPWVVTKDELPDPDRLAIKSILNGSVMQNSNTYDMLFDVASIVSDLSRSVTLLPGTVILTGTPPGVGFARKPPVFLRPGDRITISIEGIGDLSNPVQAES
jgi:2-keto-4-pentenoate hydratase/2-oxohepta-3-ene-1,7-dioic acid hydratase in catechol pathway